MSLSLYISDITCQSFTNSNYPILCNDYFVPNNNALCLAFSPFQNQLNKSNPACNYANDNCIISYNNNSDLGLNYIILNITSDTLPPANQISDYFSLMFNSVYIYDNNNKIVPNNLSFNIHPFNKGKLVMFEFSIRIRSRYGSTFSKGLGFTPNNTEAFIDTKIKELQRTDNSSDTILLLKPMNNIIYNEVETFDYTWLFIISSLGGLYSAMAGLYILIFGSPKHSPWGLAQKYMCCWNMRKKYEIMTAEHCVSNAGIPFADSPRKLKLGATIVDRVSVLEYVLRKYYLDTDYFAELNYVIQQNREYEEEFNIRITKE
ncbi:45259_t:CDS:2 [Gigaspora margarita]|uniref:45259_t:CDS:1 n=1 Tax=Gigaspora margarita TaxID=4874 RepID=A0ABN7VXZ8_GIGMA|nr:45259_t:CDS:2 [Gigaspora margarita]